MNILGTEYKINYLDERDECMVENSWQGYVNFQKKEIYVYNNECKDTTFRHECIHAFLFESGIDIGMQFHSEEMVDWLAIQLPKIVDSLDLYKKRKKKQ